MLKWTLWSIIMFSLMYSTRCMNKKKWKKTFTFLKNRIKLKTINYHCLLLEEAKRKVFSITLVKLDIKYGTTQANRKNSYLFKNIYLFDLYAIVSFHNFNFYCFNINYLSNIDIFISFSSKLMSCKGYNINMYIS